MPEHGVWNWVKPLTGNRIPHHWVFFDTETLPEPRADGRSGNIHKFRLGVAIKGRYHKGKLTRQHELVFDQPEQFWNWVFKGARKKQTTWIVAHSLIFDLLQVDFTSLWEKKIVCHDWARRKRNDEESDIESSMGSGFCVLENPPTIIGMRHIESGARYMLVDSLNWFRVPLALLGEHVGLEKLTMPPFDADTGTWIKYCRRDVEILTLAIINYVTWCIDNEMGTFRWTAASQSMSAFRHARMTSEIQIHKHDGVKKLERASYFGGRTECFRLGKLPGKVYLLDVNSLFPSVMKNELFPCQLKAWGEPECWSQTQPAIDLSQSVCEVRIDAKSGCYPVQQEDTTLYAKGKFDCVLCGPELLMAARCGDVKLWGCWATYKMDDIFSTFVDQFWEMRLEYRRQGIPLYEHYAKVILNSLYGKFGQLAPEWQDVPDVAAPEPWISWPEIYSDGRPAEMYRSAGYRVQKKVEREELSKTFVAISSFTACYARHRMDQLRLTAGVDNVYYQAVDSLVVTQAGFDRLDFAGEVNPDQLGRLKIEQVGDGCTIEGCHRYTIGTKTAHTGRKRGATILPDGSWQEEVFDVARRMFAPTGEKHVQTMVMHKTSDSTYHKGSVDAAGIVSPIELDG